MLSKDWIHIVICGTYAIRVVPYCPFVFYFFRVSTPSCFLARLLELKRAGRGVVLCPVQVSPSDYMDHHESHVHFYYLSGCFHFVNLQFSSVV